MKNINLKEQIENLIRDLNPASKFICNRIAAHGSVFDAIDNKTPKWRYSENSRYETFEGRNITPRIYFTYGTSYKKFEKRVKQILNNLPEFVTDVEVKLVKVPNWTWRASQWEKNRNIARKNTPEEYKSYNYIIEVNITGMSEQARIEIENYKREQEEAARKRQEEFEKRQNHIEYYKELHKNEVYTDCGCANGWHWSGEDKTPEIVKIAGADEDCYYEREEIGRCYDKVICHKYKFYYTVDSSD